MAVSSNLFHTATVQAYMGNIKWASARTTSADGTTSAGSASISSASANFTRDDVGASITGSTLPGGETIASVQSATAATLSTGTGVTAGTTTVFTITPVNDTIKMALFSAAPSLTSPLYADLSNEITGTGYTTGGATLSSLTAVETEANSWGTAWAASTAYTAGQVIRPATGNGFLYVCVVAGTSGGSTPTFTTVVGNTTADNTVTWSCLGEAITVFSSAAVQWTSATFSAQYAVIYDAASTDGANIAYINFGAAQSPSSGTLTVTPDASLGWFYIAPA
jgi:hypothetical protein